MPYDEESDAVYNGDIIVDISQCRDDLKDQITVSRDDSELKIHMEDRGRLNTEDSGIMYISVPRGLYFEKITANAQAGYIELAEIEAGELDVKTNTGQIIASAFFRICASVEERPLALSRDFSYRQRTRSKRLRSSLRRRIS